MLHPTQKTTITRFVHILAAVDRSYWGHNSDELAAIDPMSIFQFLPSTATQGASDHTMPEDDATLKYPCDPGLGSLHPVVPKGVTADSSSLVFPSMDPLVMPEWNEEREVDTSTKGELWLTMFFRLFQALNTTNASQCDINSRVTYHTPFYSSTNISPQPHYPDVNPKGDVMVTRYVNTACGEKMGQIDGQNRQAVAGTHSHDKGNGEQYVVWHGSGLSQVRSGFVVGNIPTLNQHAQENRPSNSLIHQMSTASVPTVAYQSRHTRLPNGADVHPTPAIHIDTDGAPSRQDAPAGLIRQQSSSRTRRQAPQRIYDKPGNKPAAPYEPDIPRLQVLSRQRGGQAFAITWIQKAFAKGMTADALRRTLSDDEINAVDHDYGFRLSQAYDGFLEKVEDRFECGLCAEEKKANWKNKKDAIRHFHKFHFGIGETCGT